MTGASADPCGIVQQVTIGKSGLVVVLLPVVLLSLARCERAVVPGVPHKGGDGTLRAAMVGEPASLNPNVGPDELAMLVGQNLFNKLVSVTADGSILPDLAERWEESADGLTYTFHLRSGVRWHDGRAFSAEDVRHTFTRLPQDSSNRELAARVAGVQVIDARTVAIRLRQPWAAFIPTLAWYGASILPGHVYGGASWIDHPANVKPIGTGPFRLKEWTPGARITLEKNGDYFGQGPFVDTVEYLIAASGEAATGLVLDRKADVLIGRPPASRIPELSRLSHVRVLTMPGEGRSYLGFNLRRRPFGDLRVRRAINMAVDRRAFVNEALSGIGIPAVGFYTPAVAWAYNAAARVPGFDLAGARRLLASAAPGGVAGTLLCAATMSRVADDLAGQLSRAGVTLRVDAVAPKEYFERLLRTRDFDVAFVSGSQGPDPDNLSSRFGSDGTQQFMGYSNAEVDAQLAAAARDSDVTRRARAYFRVQELLARDLPIAPLSESVRVTIFRAGLRGLPQDDARGIVPDFSFSLLRLPAEPR